VQLAPRALAAAALAVGSAIGVAVLATSVQRLSADGVTRLDDAVALAVMSVGLVLLLWYLASALVAIACLARRVIGGSWIAGERRLARAGAPLARRLLGAGAGAAVAAAAALAPAAATSPMPSQITDDLGWGAHDDGESLTEREQDSSTEGPAIETPTADGSAPDSPPDSTDRPGAGTPVAQPVGSASDGAETTYTVESGDSLWDIAAEHLPASAGPADIAAAWPVWYELNLDLIGPDPDLIHPGQVLAAPDRHPEEDA
jgi:nucleoid-associated protein YgaU